MLWRMRRRRWLLVPLAALLLAAGGVAAWAGAQRGYPEVVYYAHYLLLPSPANPQQVSFEEWVDPRRQCLFTLALSADGTASWLSINGVTYQLLHQAASSPTIRLWLATAGAGGMVEQVVFAPGPAAARVATPNGDSAYQLQVDQALLAAGWPRVYAAWSLRAAGPGVPMRLVGHQVLRLAVSQAVTVWLDLHTHLPVQVQVSVHAPFVPVVQQTVRFLRWVQLVPYTLPADFFDPPHARPSLWDQVTGWLHNHLR
jgi:hypothetical protein